MFALAMLTYLGGKAMSKIVKIVLACLCILIIVQTANAANHNYYGKTISKQQAELAEAIARDIANAVKADKSLTTDLAKVRAAAKWVSGFAMRCDYDNDDNKYYRSPYGVFVAGVFTCAGATRALGRVLDLLGYSWVHVNENKYEHQWCVLQMDGQKGYADANVIPGGIAGYGNRPLLGNLIMTSRVATQGGQRDPFAEIPEINAFVEKIHAKYNIQSKLRFGAGLVQDPNEQTSSSTQGRKARNSGNEGIKADIIIDTWVNDIWSSVCKTAGVKELDVFIVDDGGAKNLWIIPEDGIFITFEMADLFVREKELLFCVLAHELGHAVLKHGPYDEIINTPKMGDDQYLFALVSYSNDEEAEADLYGIRLSIKKGMRYQDFRSALEKVRKSGQRKTEYGFCSHIPDADRIIMAERIFQKEKASQ